MIRPTDPADTLAFVEMARGTGVFKPIEVQALQDVLDDYHRVNRGAGHVAVTYEGDGRPRGLAYYAPASLTDRTWYLYWIIVARETQGRGLGGMLLRHAEEEIRSLGGRLFLIETSSLPGYELTRGFYLKHGYTLAATVPDFYADSDSLCIFSKRFLPKANGLP